MLTQNQERNPNFTFIVGFNAAICPELQTDECWPNGDPKLFDLNELNIHLSKLVLPLQLAEKLFPHPSAWAKKLWPALSC